MFNISYRWHLNCWILRSTQVLCFNCNTAGYRLTHCRYSMIKNKQFSDFSLTRKNTFLLTITMAPMEWKVANLRFELAVISSACRKNISINHNKTVIIYDTTLIIKTYCKLTSTTKDPWRIPDKKFRICPHNEIPNFLTFFRPIATKCENIPSLSPILIVLHKKSHYESTVAFLTK